MAASRQRSGAIEDSDVIEPQKAALENIGAVRVLAIYPPGKIQKQFMKNLFKESTVADPTHTPLDLINAPCGPRMHRGIHISKCPFVRRQLTVGMHVPLAEQQDELLLGKIRINNSQRDAVKRQVPSGVPGILPFVRHRNDVVVIKVRPILVAASEPFFRRRRAYWITLKPGLYIVVIKLLGN